MGKIIWAIFIFYLYISTGMHWYWTYKEKQIVVRSIFVLIGSFIGMGIFFYGGFNTILFFIPESWEYFDHESGEPFSIRNSIAGFLAFFASLAVHLRPHLIVRLFTNKED